MLRLVITAADVAIAARTGTNRIILSSLRATQDLGLHAGAAGGA